jgi:hypothetical protein
MRQGLAIPETLIVGDEKVTPYRAADPSLFSPSFRAVSQCSGINRAQPAAFPQAPNRSNIP